MSGSTNSVVLPPQHDPWAGAGQQVNPLGIATQAAQLQSMGIANQSNQMMLDARTALGPILQQSIGPDGQIDYNKAAVLLSSNPKTAFIANDFINSAVQRGKAQAETVELQINNAYKQFNWIGNTAAALQQYGNNVQPGQVIQKLVDGVAMGILPIDKAQHYASLIGNMEGPQLYQHLRELALQAQGAQKSIETVYGTTQMPNVGGRVQPTATSPFMGTAKPMGPGIAMTPTPGELNAPRESTNEQTGAKSTAPGWTYGGYVNGDGTVAPGPPGAQQGPSSPAAGSVPGAANTANPVSFSEYQAGKGPAVEYEKDLNARAQMAQQQLQVFNQLSSLAQGLGPGGMGPGATTRTQLAQLAKAVGAPDSTVNAIIGGQSPNNLATAQELMKYALRNVMGAVKMDAEHQRVTQGEFAKYEEAGMPTLSTDPEAFKNLNAFMQRIVEQTLSEQQWWNKFKGHTDPQTGWVYSDQFRANPQEFPSMWNEAMVKSKQKGFALTTDLARKAFGLPTTGQ